MQCDGYDVHDILLLAKENLYLVFAFHELRVCSSLRMGN